MSYKIRLEQSKTEVKMVLLKKGNIYTVEATLLRKQKAENIANMVFTYSTYPSIMDFLESMSLNMEDEQLKEQHKSNNKNY